MDAISLPRIIQATKEDHNLQRLSSFIFKGYLPKRDTELNPYRQIFNELNISDDGLILKEERIILPSSLWTEAIEKAHQGGHPGMSSLKRRLRSHFWFPKLNECVENKVKSCPSCQLFSDKTTKEPIAPQQMPNGPWEDINLNLFGPMPNHKHVLVGTMITTLVFQPQKLYHPQQPHQCSMLLTMYTTTMALQTSIAPTMDHHLIPRNLRNSLEKKESSMKRSTHTTPKVIKLKHL